MGIDLGANGVTSNTEGNRNAGVPNNLQNFPMLTSASSASGNISVQGKFNSKTNAVFNLDFYATKSPDPSGYGQGENFLGSAAITTDENGNTTFDVALSASVPVGHFVTATATDAANNTSEFSLSIPVAVGTPAPKLSVAKSVSGDALVLFWPASAQGFVLETTDSLSPPVVWEAVINASAVAGDQNKVTVKFSGGGSGKFYRIRKPN